MASNWLLACVTYAFLFARTGVFGFVMYVNVYRLSNKYGSHGLMK